MLGQIEGLAQGMSQNMFGEAAETMKDLWKRMTREQENDATKMHQKLTQEQEAQKQTGINKDTIDGGDPLDKQHYQTTG